MANMSIYFVYDDSKSLPTLRSDIDTLKVESISQSNQITELSQKENDSKKKINILGGAVSCLETNARIVNGIHYFIPRIVKNEYCSTPNGIIQPHPSMDRTDYICLDGIDRIGLGTETTFLKANYCAFYDENKQPIAMWVFNAGDFAPLNNTDYFPTKPKYLVVSNDADKMVEMSIIIHYDDKQSLPILRKEIDELKEVWELSNPKDLKILALASYDNVQIFSEKNNQDEFIISDEAETSKIESEILSTAMETSSYVKENEYSTEAVSDINTAQAADDSTDNVESTNLLLENNQQPQTLFDEEALNIDINKEDITTPKQKVSKRYKVKGRKF